MAGASDITQGLPRVEEVFEARNPKGEAIIAEINGRVEIEKEGEVRTLKISRTDLKRREVEIPAGFDPLVLDNDRVQEDTPIARKGGPDSNDLIMAGMDGEVFVDKNGAGQLIVTIRREDTEVWNPNCPPMLVCVLNREPR